MTIVFRSDDVHNALLAYKYDGASRSGGLLARMLEGYLAAHVSEMSLYHAVISMPWRLNPDGGAPFDHMRTLLAKVAPSVPQVPIRLEPALLTKTRTTGSQASDARGREERLRQYRDIRDALEVPSVADVRFRRILIVDDVFTTGTTLNAAASRLTERGASEVSGLSLLRQT